MPPLRWIFLPFLGISIGFLAIILYITKPARLFPHHPLPLDQAIWTCDPGYQIFYGPGTSQSLAVVQRIRALQTSGYLQTLPALDQPTLIAPGFFTADSSGNDIVLLSPFTPAMAASLPAAHEPDGK